MAPTDYRRITQENLKIMRPKTTLGEMEIDARMVQLEKRVDQLEHIVEQVRKSGVLGKMFDARPRLGFAIYAYVSKVDEQKRILEKEKNRYDSSRSTSKNPLLGAGYQYPKKTTEELHSSDDITNAVIVGAALLSNNEGHHSSSSHNESSSSHSYDSGGYDSGSSSSSDGGGGGGSD